VTEEITQLVAPQLSREAFRQAVREFFDFIRKKAEWDYVLVDTRGGFTFNTTDVCALSDSFFLVTEPQFSSFYQDKNLMYRISAAAAELGRKPTLRGVVVNKATESSGDDDIRRPGTRRLDLDNVEGSFRNVLVDEFSIRYSDTHPVPLDIRAVEAYKSQRIPYVAFPGSVFSYATLVAFSGMMRTVTVRWPEEVTKRWNALVDRISEAIKAANEGLIQQAAEEQALHEDKDKLMKDNEFLRAQIKLVEESATDREKYYEHFRMQAAKGDRARMFMNAALGATLFVAVVGGAYSYVKLQEQIQVQAVTQERLNSVQEELRKLQNQLSAPNQSTK
jgi:hypothetical protein